MSNNNRTAAVLYARNIANQSEKLPLIRNKIKEVAEYRDIEVLDSDTPISLINKIKLGTADFSHPNYFPELYLSDGRQLEIDETKLAGLSRVRAGAFKNSKVSSIILPNDVTEIGDEAFMNAENLFSIRMDGVQKIGKRCFKGTMLQSIQIPKYVEELDKEILSGSAITDLDLSKCLKKQILREEFEDSLISKEIGMSLIIVPEEKFDTYYNDTDYIWQAYRNSFAGKVSGLDPLEKLPEERNGKKIYWYKNTNDAKFCGDRITGGVSEAYFRIAETTEAHFGTFIGKVQSPTGEYICELIIPRETKEFETLLTFAIHRPGLGPVVNGDFVVVRYSENKGYTYDIVVDNNDTHFQIDSINDVKDHRYRYSINSDIYSGIVEQISLKTEA